MRLPCARSEVVENLLTADVAGGKSRLDSLAMEVRDSERGSRGSFFVGLFSEPAKQSMDSGTSSQAKAKYFRLKP